MDLLICDLYNKTSKNSDTAMSKEWLMRDEWNGRKNVHLGLLELHF
jgi:hypothetical protein